MLTRHGVCFVVIGGFAAMVHDLPLPATIVVDITPGRAIENLERMATAFNELQAGLLTSDAGGTWVRRHPIANWASHHTLHLMTKFGPLYIVFAPDGAEGGYADLAGGAEQHTVGQTTAFVTSFRIWERLKEAAGRAKDLKRLDLFRQHGS